MGMNGEHRVLCPARIGTREWREWRNSDQSGQTCVTVSKRNEDDAVRIVLRNVLDVWKRRVCVDALTFPFQILWLFAAHDPCKPSSPHHGCDYLTRIRTGSLLSLGTLRLGSVETLRHFRVSEATFVHLREHPLPYAQHYRAGCTSTVLGTSK